MQSYSFCTSVKTFDCLRQLKTVYFQQLKFSDVLV